MRENKKTLIVFAVLVCLIGAPLLLMATNPTVTRAYKDRKSVFYEFTYSTTLANTDTALIYHEISGTVPFDLEGRLETDSLITSTFYTDETTADSVQHKILWQATLSDNPGSDDWVTLETDSIWETTGIVRDDLNIKRYGMFKKLRVLVAEEVDSVAENSAQAIQFKLSIPN